MLSRRLAYVTLALILAACGKIPDADDGADDEGDDIDAGIDGGGADPCDQEEFETDEFVDCFVHLNCGVLVTCGFAFSEVEECETAFRDDPEPASGIRRLEDAIAAGRTEIDSEEFVACIEAFEAAAASGICSAQQPDECADIFAGQLSGNDVCYDSFECAGSGSQCTRGCEGDEQCCAGTCQTSVGEGRPCNNAIPCENGLHCVVPPVGGNEGTCQDGEGGAVCNSSSDCDQDFFCSAAACVADFDDGSNCGADEACLAPLLCIAGSCQHAYENDDCEDECENGFYCEPGPSGGPGTCRAAGVAVGDGCPCRGSLICVAEKCAERPGEGDDCTSGTCAFGLFCSTELPSDGTEPVTGTCLAPQADGSPCSGSSQCQSGECHGNPRVCVPYQSCE